ncbi:MAG TPA: hypothetical protein VMX56_00465 [Anaerolineales bacterium]|nr:hypothetical protein [Anaerolineales bacterium]
MRLLYRSLADIDWKSVSVRPKDPQPLPGIRVGAYPLSAEEREDVTGNILSFSRKRCRSQLVQKEQN